MSQAFDYSTFVLRNNGYVSAEVQAKVRESTLMFAGCGIGSAPAIAAARFGFERFILVDGDVVRLEQVFSNLIGNAVATRPSGKRS